jgi:hypothetical protein
MKASTSAYPAILLLCLASNQLLGQRTPPKTPATIQNILTETKQSETGEGQVIYVDNRSSEDIIVKSISLTACENIRESCHVISLKIRIKGGDKRVVYRIHARSPDAPYTYTPSISWEVPNDSPSPPSEPAAGAVTADANTARVPFAVPSQLIDVTEFRPAVAAVDSGGVCVNVTNAGMPQGHTALLMQFGPLEAPLRQVAVEIDSAGRVFEYYDARGDLRAPVGATRLDAPPAGLRTTISINLFLQSGSLQNIGGGRPTESFSVRGAGILLAENLGNPALLIDRLMRECGKH